MELTAIIYAWFPLSENKLIELLLYSPIFEIELEIIMLWAQAWQTAAKISYRHFHE